MGITIWAPVGYLGFLFSSLWLFSKVYRSKPRGNKAYSPWFPPHKTRDLYISLLSLEPPPPRPILVAALLRRAMDDVKLIWSTRDTKAALTTLLGKGQIGDELWERFLLAEKELEAEIVEVVGEANTFQEGYGQQIFGLASEMVSHEKWKVIYKNIQQAREDEKVLMKGDIVAQVLAPIKYASPSSLTLLRSIPADTIVPSGPAPLASIPVSPPSPSPSNSLLKESAKTGPETPVTTTTTIPEPTAEVDQAKEGNHDDEDGTADSSIDGQGVASSTTPVTKNGSTASSTTGSTPGSAKKNKKKKKNKGK